MKALLSTILSLGLLAGCVGPGILTGMNEKQIEAMAKIKDAASGAAAYGQQHLSVCLRGQGYLRERRRGA